MAKAKAPATKRPDGFDLTAYLLDPRPNAFKSLDYFKIRASSHADESHGDPGTVGGG
jgi:hypothetical protein